MRLSSRPETITTGSRGPLAPQGQKSLKAVRTRHGEIEQQQIDVLFRFEEFPRLVDRAGLESFRDGKGR